MLGNLLIELQSKERRGRKEEKKNPNVIVYSSEIYRKLRKVSSGTQNEREKCEN